MTGLPSPSTIPAKTRPWLEKKPSVFTLMASQIQANNLYHRRHFLVTLSNADYPFVTCTSLSISAAKPRTKPKLKPQKLSICSSLLASSSSISDKNPPDACEETNEADARTSDSPSIQKEKRMKKKRLPLFLSYTAAHPRSPPFLTPSAQAATSPHPPLLLSAIATFQLPLPSLPP